MADTHCLIPSLSLHASLSLFFPLSCSLHLFLFHSLSSPSFSLSRCFSFSICLWLSRSLSVFLSLFLSSPSVCLSLPLYLSLSLSLSLSLCLSLCHSVSMSLPPGLAQHSTPGHVLDTSWAQSCSDWRGCCLSNMSHNWFHPAMADRE